MENIAFIGLGHMGQPMAKNLLKAGYKVKAYDIAPQAVQALAAAGATAGSSVADVVKDADVIITMLQTGEQVSDTCLRKEGIFANAKKNALMIDCSSIDITVSQELHEKAKNAGIALVDAPVSGGVAGAEAGTLTVMVGGEDTDFNHAKPILEKLGKKIIHAGKGGQGQVAKICNNLILGISMIAVSEGFTLAEKLGMEPKKFFEIASNSSASCWTITNYCPAPGVLEKAPSNNNYKAGFMAKMMLKDLLLAMHAAETSDTAIPLGGVTTELYQLFVKQGYGDMDFSGIIKMIAAASE